MPIDQLKRLSISGRIGVKVNVLKQFRELAGVQAQLSPQIRAQHAIDMKYETLGGEAGFLRLPVGDMAGCFDRVGYLRHYEGGSIFWHPKTGAHEIHGAIREKWFELGAERTFLGYPVTDTSPCAAPPSTDPEVPRLKDLRVRVNTPIVDLAILESDTKVGTAKFTGGRRERTIEQKGGWFNHFQRGSIYWTKDTGAHAIHGPIREKWFKLGGERGLLGFPTGSPKTNADGIGSSCEFQNGSIYSSPATGTFEVHGAIREKWISLGGEHSFLGYPISDETIDASGNPYSQFERGRIVWKSMNGTAMVEPDTVTHKVDISASTVVGWAIIELSSDGFWSYRGHVHQTGYTGDDYALAATLVVGDPSGQALVFSEDGSVGGKLNSDSSNEDWSQSGYHPLIAEHWETIRMQGVTFTLKVGTNPWQFLESALYSLLIAAGAAITIWMHATGDCHIKGEGTGIDSTCRREW